MAIIQPRLEPVEGPWWRASYEVDGDWWCYWTDRQGRRRCFLVPDGFPTDGSSEWWVLPFVAILPSLVVWALDLRPDGIKRGSRVGHDRGYARLGAVDSYTCLPTGRWCLDVEPLTRAEVDWLMYDVARESGVPWWQRGLKYPGVRVLGWPVWTWRRVRRWRAKRALDKRPV